MLTKISTALVVCAVGAGVVYAAPTESTDLARRHSCGYHCNPDGSDATPAAPPTEDQAPPGTVTDVQPAGRTNVHSGGRLHGSSNKRVGCGGCKGNPASIEISGLWDVQPMGRTNVHSNGRAGGKAESRGGSGRDTRTSGWH